jgi:hypothetical protein
MYDLSESTSISLKSILESYVSIEDTFIQVNKEIIEHENISITAINPKEDIDIFIKGIPQVSPFLTNQIEPGDIEFEPTILWKDNVDMANDEYSKVFLINKLKQIRSKMDFLQHDIGIKQKGVDGMATLQEAYLKNNHNSEANDVMEVIAIIIDYLTLALFGRRTFLISIES